MNTRNSIIGAVVVFWMLFLGSAVSVSAEGNEPPTVDLSEAISTLNISNSTIREQKDNKFWITFDVGNGDGIEAGIRPVIRLYNTKEGNERELAHVYRDENIYLFRENTTMSVLVTYEAPQNLNGEYEMYVSLENPQHLFLGTLFIKKIMLQGVSGNTVDIVDKGDMILDPFTGKDVAIWHVSLKSSSFAKGDEVKVSLLWKQKKTDDAEVGETPTAMVTLVDADGSLCGEAPTQLQSWGSRELVSVTLVKDCKDPTVNVVLYDTDSSVFDETTIPFYDEGSADTDPFSGKILALLLLFGFIILFILLYLKQKKINVNKNILSIFMVSMIAGTLFIASSEDAFAEMYDYIEGSDDDVWF